MFGMRRLSSKLVNRCLCGLVLSGLVLGISGCGQSDATTSDTETEANTEADTEEVSAPELDFTFDNVEDFITTDWKKAYYAKLVELREGNESTQEDSEIVYEYSLYDMDQDEVPELIAKKGSSEASSNIDVYTYKEEEVQFVGNIGASHCSYYSCPNENGMLSMSGHTNALDVTKIVLKDGQLEEINIDERQILNYELWPQAKDYVEGAERLDSYRIRMDLPIIEYERIQPLSYRYTINDKEERKEIENQLIDIIENNGMVYGVSGDGFGKEVGYVSFEEYCSPGIVEERNNLPMEVKEYKIQDFDGNGMCEVALWLEEQPGGNKQTAFVILSRQWDVTYAYSFSSNYERADIDYGILSYGISSYDSSAYKFSFYKDQCYLYYEQAYTEYLTGLKDARSYIESNLPNANITDEDLPTGIHLLDICEGDLDKDGKQDFVVVLEVAEDSDSWLQYDGPRVVYVFNYAYHSDNFEKDVYRCSYVNNMLVMPQSYGGIFGDPYGSMEIKDGTLRISDYGGDSYRWRDDFTFGMDSENFVLKESRHMEGYSPNVVETIWNYEKGTFETYAVFVGGSLLINKGTFESETILFEDASLNNEGIIREFRLSEEMQSLWPYDYNGVNSNSVGRRESQYTAEEALDLIKEKYPGMHRVDIACEEEIFENYETLLGYAPPRYYYEDVAGNVLIYNRRTYDDTTEEILHQVIWKNGVSRSIIYMVHDGTGEIEEDIFIPQ